MDPIRMVARTGRVRMESNRAPYSFQRFIVALDSMGQLDGGQRWNRTTDTGIFSPLLYRLSYLAMFFDELGRRSAMTCYNRSERPQKRP